MALSDVKPRAQLMATYYEKLARIFWVSENYLFHGLAWTKFFALSVAQNRGLSEEDRRAMASAAVLAALAIPPAASVPAAGGNAAGALDIDAERERKAKLAALLQHTSSLPSREALLRELTAKGALRLARPDVAALYRLLEVDFAPLTLVSSAVPLLKRLCEETGPTVSAAGTLGTAASGAATNTLAQYVPNLERLAVHRALEQLSTVYTTLTLPALGELLGGLSLPPHEIERLIVRAVRARLLSVRVDHAKGIARFGRDALEGSASRRQLTQLAVRLTAVVEVAGSPGAAAAAALASAPGAAAIAAGGAESARAAQRAAISEAARESLVGAAARAAARRAEIESRKEDAERKRQLDIMRVRVRAACVLVCVGGSVCGVRASHTQQVAAAGIQPRPGQTRLQDVSYPCYNSPSRGAPCLRGGGRARAAAP